MDEDVKEFLIEGYEYLNQIEEDLVALEKNDADREVMNRIYRGLHTIKGNSGFLGVEKLESVAHAGENLLSLLRDRTLTMTPDITSALLETIDAVRSHMEALEKTGEESPIAHTALLDRLLQLQESGGTASELSSSAIAESNSVTPEVAIEEPEESELTREHLYADALLSIEQLLIPSATNTTSQQVNAADTEGDKFKISDTAIRVDVGLLDKLMNLVGELVLCRNQILEFANTQTANTQNDDTLKSVSSRLNLVTSELQEGVMKTRMQPIRTIWNKFPRVVRDTAFSLGKQVQLEMEGEETELDKTLIEAIANPLTHLVRNCLDHGIETSEVRVAKGKPAFGKLLLRAYHESGQVNIEISDDGGGIDPERIKSKAVQKGMFSAVDAAKMSDREALNLIFMPSFSTAEKITNISGRGVGMDVVQTHIEKISGTIDVQSQVGKGTTFKLKIPLTLAIIPTLIITTGGSRYAIPQVNLLELMRLEGEQIKKIEMFHGTPVYRLRGRLLPLIYLNRELQLETGIVENGKKSQFDTDEALNIVVVQATDKPFGLVVDAINDTQEIVVKPLGKQLKSLACFAGATIMGDGKVALILDVHGIAQKTHMTEAQEKAILADENSRRESSEPPQQLLVFQGPDCRRMAIHLSRVCRLEEFPRHLLERVGKQNVVQYRNQIMPVIYLTAVFGSGSESADWGPNGLDGRSRAADDKLPLVVVSIGSEHQVGLVVDRILDIVEQAIDIKGAATQAGISYCAVIQGQVTEILDVDAVINNNLFGVEQMLASTSSGY
ncbi:MAG: chemotaxis protein CheW [Microcoleus sp. PH2017_40_RAT_O_B]|nr:chemotaxis protein CheW [Microcoleus sp. PH2017_15_JOR_U_A]MCC3573151.1 chemotaxis protein CheW [Microcoleus sp. PH2017_34_RAT_O_A]MCC3610579.1 chemotaxis protein CheW [Microcoleus sp. PH2017_40_RAT_O_B]TAE56291.1 MAG: chemotaxis protein CheA [Oscillatoriales cyanobacterium]